MATKKKNTETNEMFEMKVRLSFTNPLLGTVSTDKDLALRYQMAKVEDLDTKDEYIDLVEALDQTLPETLGTAFLRAEPDDSLDVTINDEGKAVYLSSHMVLGFFKEACGGLRRNKGTKSADLTAFKKVIDTNIFIKERKLFVQGKTTITHEQRSLRTNGPKGERVALASSEKLVLVEGVTDPMYVECTIQCIQPDLAETIAEWLDYGQHHGLGQWRNSGYGTFTWELIDGGYTSPVLNESNQNRLQAMLKEHKIADQ